MSSTITESLAAMSWPDDGPDHGPTDDLCAARGDLAAAQARIARLEAELAAQHPVVEAAVAAVEAQYTDTRLRELALAVRHFCARRACAERGR